MRFGRQFIRFDEDGSVVVGDEDGNTITIKSDGKIVIKTKGDSDANP